MTRYLSWARQQSARLRAINRVLVQAAPGISVRCGTAETQELVVECPEKRGVLHGKIPHPQAAAHTCDTRLVHSSSSSAAVT